MMNAEYIIMTQKQKSNPQYGASQCTAAQKYLQRYECMGRKGFFHFLLQVFMW